MKRITIAIFLGIGLLIPSISARHKNGVTNHFIQPSVKSKAEVRRCTYVESQSEMESELVQLGWPFNRSNPSIDWNTDCAIIISPGEGYFDADLAFIDLIWHEDRYVLRWGFWNPRLRIYRGTHTLGNGNVPKPEQKILIVAINHDVHAKNKLECQEYVSK